MSKRSLSRVVVMGVVVLGGALAACVGDAPYGGTPDDADASPAAPGVETGTSTSPSSPGHDGGGSSSSPPSDAGADAARDSSAASDAAMRPDAAPAPLVCSEPVIPMNAFNFRCSAKAATLVNPGGTLTAGTYVLGRYWANVCSAYQIGWADVFEQDGATYIRYERIERAIISDPGTKHIGTMKLDVNAGTVDVTERCDAATMGAMTSGDYVATNVAGVAPTLTLSFVDHQEQWTKQ